MRILLITDTLIPTYGWGRYAIGLIRALRRQELDFTLLSPRAGCHESDLLELPDHETVTSFVTETRRIPRLVLANALRIRRALQRCDLVHCLTEPYAIPAALVSGGKPLFVTLHGTYAVRPFTRWQERPWYEMAYQRATRLLPVSEFTRSLLPDRFQGPRTQVIPEGVDIERFTLATAAQPAAPSAPAAPTTPAAPATLESLVAIAAPGEPPETSEQPYLLSVGPIKRRKGYHRTIEAFARIHAQRPDVVYKIVGATDDPIFFAQLKERIAALGLSDAVHFLGRVSEAELLPLYAGCAVFWLLPISDDLQFEGFGLVYWEANACGRPIVGAERSGAEDAIVHGENGFLVPTDDPAAASDAVLRLLADPALAAEMGAAGRRRVRPWDDAAGLLIQAYRATLSGAAPESTAAPRTVQA